MGVMGHNNMRSLLAKERVADCKTVESDTDETGVVHFG